MATVTTKDGIQLAMRVPMYASEIAALDEARDAEFVREVGTMYRIVSAAALDDETRAHLAKMPATDIADVLTLWSGASEDDAIPPASGTSS